jgi:hypothetical protein
MLALLIGPLGMIAASPAPEIGNPLKLQENVALPTTKLHTEYVVEVNKLGQVTRVRSGVNSSNIPFNEHTYGNTLQAFIRKPDGSVVVGSYRLTYDYDPRSKMIHRDVALVKAGGVDPNAKGAVIEMEELARKHTPEPEGTPVRVDPRNLPNLPDLSTKTTH